MDWQSSKTHILLNPRLPEEEAQSALNYLPKGDLQGHVWLSTSGSSGYIKWVALSKNALLASAAAVNSHFHSNANDRWLNPLPTFHVGGLGIHARAHLSGAKVFALEKWDPDQFAGSLFENGITLTSLVPAQVFDLVQRRISSPKSLRGIVVGGAHLQQELYLQAKQLGWSLYPSYGMTEAGSQIATAASVEDPRLAILPHICVKANEEGFLTLEGPSLFTAYAHIRCGKVEFEERVRPFVTEDRGVVQEGRLILFGRNSHFIKIGGESVDLYRLERILEELKLKLNFGADAAIFANEDDRLGHVIHLASTGEDAQVLVDSYNASVLPFEKVRKVHYLEELPRSPLKKLLVKELRKKLRSS